jgi:serine protease
MLDGKPIPNAAQPTYKLLKEQIGRKLKLQITLKKEGVKDTVFSSPSKKVLAKALKKAPIPTISGKERIGKTLTASIGTWDAGTNLKIQWYRNGKAIQNATKSTYKLTTYDFDQHITVKVTATKKDFATTSRVSEPTKKIANK